MIFATILYQVHLSCTAYFPENHFVFKILCIYVYTNIQYINISVVYIYYNNGCFPKKKSCNCNGYCRCLILLYINQVSIIRQVTNRIYCTQYKCSVVYFLCYALRSNTIHQRTATIKNIYQYTLYGYTAYHCDFESSLQFSRLLTYVT